MTDRLPDNALSLAEHAELSRQAAWVRRWNASRPILSLADIPWGKGSAPTNNERSA